MSQSVHGLTTSEAEKRLSTPVVVGVEPAALSVIIGDTTRAW